MNTMDTMTVGAVFAGRFEIMGTPKRGGMGRVVRARTLADSRAVALKTLAIDEPSLRRYFERECEALARIQHPGVAGYVAHGVTEDEAPWLAMEWVEGGTLAARLARGPLREADCAQLGAGLAESLRAVHGAGMVHRDVKPSNIVLRDGEPGAPVLVDFGTARGAPLPDLTVAGILVGTPGYIAPEQLSSTWDEERGGRSATGPAADAWALGAVLWECLRGERMIEGNNDVARLTRTLVAEPRDVGDTPGCPGLRPLIARLVSRDPAMRPTIGPELIAELDAIVGGSAGPRRYVLGSQERGLLCVMVGGEPDTHDSTLVQPRPRAWIPIEQFTALARGHGVELEAIGRTGWVAWTRPMSGEALPALAERAAAFAEAAHQSLPELPAAIVLGLGASGAQSDLGSLVDAAARLLALPPAEGVRLDAMIAGLLGTRVRVVRDAHGDVLPPRPGRTASERPRAPTSELPFIGRERELEVIETLVSRARRDREPHLLWVRGGQGMGKSRLAREVIARNPGCVAIRCDPRDRYRALDLARAVVLLHDSELVGPRMDERDALEAIGRAHGLDERDCHLLGDLSRDGGPRTEARELHRDPTAWVEAMERALVTWGRAATKQRACVVVVDDAHLADAPSLEMLARVLPRLDGSPVALLALSSDLPSVPDLDRIGAEHLTLGKLRRREVRELLSRIRGDEVSDPTLDTVLAASDGSPLGIVEAARFAHEPGAEAPTMRAMIQQRLLGLPSATRRALRALAIAGHAARAETLAMLLGLAAERALEPLRLAQAEGLVDIEGDRVRFRHELFREAVYESTATDDLLAGHAIVAEQLERAEADHAEIAEHLERAASARAAAAHWIRAAAGARRRNDLFGARGLALRAEQCLDRFGLSASDLQLEIDTLLSEIGLWSGEHGETLRRAERALLHAQAGTTAWRLAVAVAARATEAGPRREKLLALARSIVERTQKTTTDSADWTLALRVTRSLAVSGYVDEARSLLARVESAVGEATPEFVAERSDAAMVLHAVSDEYGDAIAEARVAMEAFRRMEATPREAFAAKNLAMILGLVGQRAHALEALGHADRLAAALRMDSLRHILVAIRAQLHEQWLELDEALALRRDAMERGARARDPLALGAYEAGLARVLYMLGRVEQAHPLALAALERLRGSTRIGRARTVLAATQWARGEVREAVDNARAALPELAAVQDRDHLSFGHEAVMRVLGAAGDTLGADTARAAGVALMGRIERSLQTENERAVLRSVPAYSRLRRGLDAE